MNNDQNNNSHHHHILICRSTPAVVKQDAYGSLAPVLLPRGRACGCVDDGTQTTYLSEVKPKFTQPIRTNVKMKGESYPSDLKMGLTGGLPPSRRQPGPSAAGVGRCKGRRRSLSESDMMHPLPSLASPRQRSKSKSHAQPARGSSFPPNIYRRWSGVAWSFKSQNIGSTFSTFPLTGFSARTGVIKFS
jgi:hypothetical protein